MGERDDKLTVVEGVGGGGSVIAGIVIGAAILLLLLFVFGDRIFSADGARTVDVGVNLPKVDAPAK